MNRRGFFGQMAACAAMARGLPKPLALTGLAGWLPARAVLGENFFGLDRKVSFVRKVAAGKYRLAFAKVAP